MARTTRTGRRLKTVSGFGGLLGPGHALLSSPDSGSLQAGQMAYTQQREEASGGRRLLACCTLQS